MWRKTGLSRNLYLITALSAVAGPPGWACEVRLETVRSLCKLVIYVVLTQFIFPNDALVNLFLCVLNSLNNSISLMNENDMLPLINICMGWNWPIERQLWAFGNKKQDGDGSGTRILKSTSVFLIIVLIAMSGDLRICVNAWPVWVSGLFP